MRIVYGLYAAAFVLVALIAFVAIPAIRIAAVKADEQHRRRADVRRRREHFTLTTRYRQEFDPVFEGLHRLGRDLDRI